MLALKLNDNEVKAFMGLLLREELFDGFDVRSVEISAGVHISIDCGGEDGFSCWGEMRPLVHTIIKSGPKPRLVKIIFSHKAQQTVEIHPNAAALFLNLVYENDNVSFTTATAQKEFALDKTHDATWDEWVMRFFQEKGLPVVSKI